MPVITLHTPDLYVPEQVQHLSETLAGRLALTLRVPPHLPWVHFVHLTHVQEGLHGTVDTPHLVVTVLANPRPDEVVHQAMTDIAGTLAEQLHLDPDRSWIHWTDLPPRRTFADGNLS